MQANPAGCNSLAKEDSPPQGAKPTLTMPISCENNKSRESSEGLVSQLHHDRTSEQLNNAHEDNFVANSNPRNKSTFSKQLGSQESSIESCSPRHIRPAQKNKGPCLMASAAEAAHFAGSSGETSALKMRRNKKGQTAAQI